uniref:Uncharacterized protein n=1 Tax=Anguilla anguilla TaxID=7936 RepID=A0A0E9UJS3_ANGAN
MICFNSPLASKHTASFFTPC